MIAQRLSRRQEAGFTLVEILITLVVLALVMGSTVGFFRSQNQSFLNASQRLDALQNARFAISQVERELRTLGAGVAGQQPMLVYGNANVIAFNTDYVENDTTDFRWAVYFNPNVTNTAAQGWLQTDAGTIPNSSPAFTYPPVTYRQGNGAVSPAETHMFWLQLDASTTRADDYILWERTNNETAELVSRNVLQMGSKPFFEYFLARKLASGADTLMLTPSGNLPLIRIPLTGAMTGTDSANATRPDSIQAVRMNFRITNGLTGTSERLRDVSTVVALPNNGMPSASICGRSPFPAGTLSAVQDTIPGSGRIILSWGASPDQEAGELDVWQYVIYRKLSGAPLWEDPIMNLNKTVGAATYSQDIGGNTSGVTYDFAVSAQDCTPAMSTMVQASVMAP
jgi:prepilin-type N-terminal cleavage/methylation domain-containing protein